MPGLFDDLAPLSSTYAAEDYMAQRKRLREARARWIEENECPTASVIEHTDKDGNVIGTSAVGGPFQTGICRYDGDIPAGQAPGSTGYKPSFLPPAEDASAPEDLDKLDAIIEEAATFMAPGIYRESPHPELREGEDYGTYCARVGREYERAAGRMPSGDQSPILTIYGSPPQLIRVTSEEHLYLAQAIVEKIGRIFVITPDRTILATPANGVVHPSLSQPAMAPAGSQATQTGILQADRLPVAGNGATAPQGTPGMCPRCQGTGVTAQGKVCPICNGRKVTR